MAKLGVDDEEAPSPMPINERQMQKLFQGKGFCYLCAARASQSAITGYLPKGSSSKKKRYSAFTLGLSYAFSGLKKNENDEFIYVSDLVMACSQYVYSKTNHKQQPSFDYKGENFAVGKCNRGAAGDFPLLGDDVIFDDDSGDESSGDESENDNRVENLAVGCNTTISGNSKISTGDGSPLIIGSYNKYSGNSRSKKN